MNAKDRHIIDMQTVAANAHKHAAWWLEYAMSVKGLTRLDTGVERALQNARSYQDTSAAAYRHIAEWRGF